MTKLNGVVSASVGSFQRGQQVLAIGNRDYINKVRLCGLMEIKRLGACVRVRVPEG